MNLSSYQSLESVAASTSFVELEVRPQNRPENVPRKRSFTDSSTHRDVTLLDV